MHLSAANQIISTLSLRALNPYEWEFWAQQPLDVCLNTRGLADGSESKILGKMD